MHIKKSIILTLFPIISLLMVSSLHAQTSLTLETSYPANNQQSFDTTSPLIFEFSHSLRDTTINTRSHITNCTDNLPIVSDYTIDDTLITITPQNNLYRPHRFCIAFTGIEGSNGESLATPTQITFWTGTQTEEEAFNEIVNADNDITNQNLLDAGVDNLHQDYINDYNDAIDELDDIRDISDIQQAIDDVNQRRGIEIFENLYPDRLNELTLDNLKLLGLDNVYDGFWQKYLEHIIANKASLFINGNLSLSALQALINNVNRVEALRILAGFSLGLRDADEITFDIFRFAGLQNLYQRNLDRYKQAIDDENPNQCASSTIVDTNNAIIPTELQACIGTLNTIIAQEELDRLAGQYDFLNANNTNHRDIIKDNIDSIFDEEGNIIALRLQELIQAYSDEITHEYQKGDVNTDGQITIYDALQILRRVAGLEETIVDDALAKLTCDDDIDSLDAVRILQYSVGNTTYLLESCEL